MWRGAGLYLCSAVCGDRRFDPITVYCTALATPTDTLVYEAQCALLSCEPEQSLSAETLSLAALCTTPRPTANTSHDGRRSVDPRQRRVAKTVELVRGGTNTRGRHVCVAGGRLDRLW